MGGQVGTAPPAAAPHRPRRGSQLDTQVEVWEQPCAGCGGSGWAAPRWGSRGRRYAQATCLLCRGLGAVRVASTRLGPRLRDTTSGDVAGLGRAQPQEGQD